MAKKKHSEQRQARQFSIMLVVLLTLLAAGFHFIGGHSTRAVVALVIAALAGTCSFLAFPLWLRFFRQWMKFANVLGTIMSTVILTIFFFLIFTPITLLVRLTGKQLLDLKWKDGKPTYWIDKPELQATLERYEKQF